jgi:hypothetical protein
MICTDPSSVIRDHDHDRRASRNHHSCMSLSSQTLSASATGSCLLDHVTVNLNVKFALLLKVDQLGADLSCVISASILLRSVLRFDLFVVYSVVEYRFVHRLFLLAAIAGRRCSFVIVAICLRLSLPSSRTDAWRSRNPLSVWGGRCSTIAVDQLLALFLQLVELLAVEMPLVVLHLYSKFKCKRVFAKKDRICRHT